MQVIAVVATIAFFDVIPATRRRRWRRPYGHLTSAFLPSSSAVTAVVAHVFSCVPDRVRRPTRQWRWFWLSFAYKTALDGFAAWAILSFGCEGIGPEDGRVRADASRSFAVGRRRRLGLAGDGREAT